MRQYWNRYFADVHGVIFVIDGACTGDELHETSEALHNAIKNPLLSQKPWLILSNKKDLDEALTENQVSRKIPLLRFAKRINLCETLSHARLSLFSYIQVAEELHLAELIRTSGNITIKSSSKTDSNGLRSIFEQYGVRLRETYHPQDDESEPMNSI